MITTRTRLKFECIIELGEDDDIQYHHLPGELEAYFNTYENNIDVVSWNIKEVKWTQQQNGTYKQEDN